MAQRTAPVSTPQLFVQHALLTLLLLASAVVLFGLVRLVCIGLNDVLLPLGIALMVALAYVNGANDDSKVIATLVGSGVTDYHRAIAWGALGTIVGSLSSALLANTLIGTFTKGFIVPGVRQTEIFALAVLVGAILWVLLATRIAMPVSTTHAITGSLVTVGAVVFWYEQRPVELPDPEDHDPVGVQFVPGAGRRFCRLFHCAVHPGTPGAACDA
jgi:hypothetical protein